MLYTSCRLLTDFYNKINFDYGRHDVTAYTYHPQFRMTLASLGIFFGNKTTHLRLILPVYNIIITLCGIVMEGIAIWHGIMVQDYGLAAECFSYVSVWVTCVLLYISVLINGNKIYQMADDMNTIFLEIYDIGFPYRTKFMETQLVIWKLWIIWCSFIMFVLKIFIGYPLLKLIYMSIVDLQDDDVVRPLPLPMWLPSPYDPFQTPNYEMFFIFHTLLGSACALTFSAYIPLMFHVLLHYYALMDVIILDFKVLFEELEELAALLPAGDKRRDHVQTILAMRMKRMVKWHKSILKVVETVSLIFGPPLVYQVLASPFAICVMAYEIAHKLDRGELDLFFIFLLLACLLQIWVPCYLGTTLRSKAVEVGEACWNCGWEDTSLTRLIRQDIIIFILRCQKPLTIKFVGLPYVDLETYSSIVTRGYSLFNMLRQYSEMK